MDFSVIIEKDEDGYYVATIPALKGCYTQAKSLDVLNVRILEVVDLCLEEQRESFKPLEFVGMQRIRVAV